MREIGFEDARDHARRFVGDDVAIKLAAERRVRAKAAADQDVIALDRIVVFVGLAPCRPGGRSRTRNAARRNDGSRSDEY